MNLDFADWNIINIIFMCWLCGLNKLYDHIDKWPLKTDEEFNIID